MKIVADNTIPFLKGICEPVADISYLPAKGFTTESIKDADALIVRSIDKCTENLLKGTNVRLITTATIGFDHIDIHFCEKNNISWKNAPGCNAPSVAQYVMSSLIHLVLRKNESLKGKTLGIIGVGHVGKQVEKLAHLFGMKVLRNDPPRAKQEGNEQFVSIDKLLSESDIVTLHVPFTKEGDYPTYHLADKNFFTKLKKGSWFVNSCRGGVHNTNALIKAKKDGIIDEIIIDCWENEPAISPELLELTSVASPHIAGFSADGKATGTRMCLEEIQSFFHIQFDKLDEVTPKRPENPIIDLDQFADYRIERAFLTTFNPEYIDNQLRKDITSFERLRNNYDHPREPKAYQIVNATSEESKILTEMGFIIES